MGEVVTIGMDIAKSVFQVHGWIPGARWSCARQLRRAQLLTFFAKQPACLVGIEACASARHWARELGALGHQIRLMPASYVKPDVKRQKNDAADAEAICEAVTRPTRVGRAWWRFLAWARCLPARWSPASPILLSSRPAAAWPRGSVWSLDRTPAAGRSGSAVSPNRATVTYASCLSSAPWPSFADLDRAPLRIEAVMGLRRLGLFLRAVGLATVCAFVVACGPSRAAPAGLILERSIPLPGVVGRIDHLAIDLAGRRLFVSALGNNTIEVLDLRTGARVAQIHGQTEPQGLAWLAGRGELVAASADGQVGIYGGDDLKRLAMLKLGEDADNVRIDAAGRPVVGFGAGELATIDPVSRRAVATARLPAHPESFRIDGTRAFVNIPNARQTALIDLASGTVIATWPTQVAHWNFPMALDKAQGLLAIADRVPPRLRLLETSTGRTVLEASVCGDSDDLFFDAKRRRIYVVCGSGDIDVFQAASRTGYVRLARVATRKGARTGLFVPEDDRLYVAARAGSQPAAILVYRPAP